MNSVNPPPPNQEPEPSPEQQKLFQEIANLQEDRLLKQAERSKVALEAAKTERELGRTWVSRAFNAVLPYVAPITAILVAGAAIVTVVYGHLQELDRQESEEFHRVVADFSSSASAVRAGAAAQLGYFACCNSNAPRRPHARALLLSAVGSETEFSVRDALETSLRGLGTDVLADVTSRRGELTRELKIAFGRGHMPTCKSFGDRLVHLRAMQEGLLLLARVKSRLDGQPLDLREAPFRCAMLIGADLSGANLARASLWQADVSESNLNHADLSDGHVDEADLSKADVTDARFCGSKVSGLTIRIIRGARGWESASYTKSFALYLKRRTRKIINVCP